MRYLKLVIIVFFFSQFNLLAQEPTKKFGEVSKSDFAILPSSKDKKADAIVLYDIGKSYFNERQNSFDDSENNSYSVKESYVVASENPFEVYFERKTRIKIISAAGLKWTEIEIPFYQNASINEEISNIKANIYSVVDGKLKKQEVSSFDFNDEKTSKNWRVRKFKLPYAKIGSIIEYKYKIRSQYINNLRDWKFQWMIPVKYSEYKVAMIPFYEYSWILQGAKNFSSRDTYMSKDAPRQYGVDNYTPLEFRDKVDKYVMKDIPAFADEVFTTSIDDYIIKIDFQLDVINQLNGSVIKVGTTWPVFIKDLLKSKVFGKYVKRSKKMASKLFDLDTLKKKTVKERYNTIINYVKNNYIWNNYSDKYTSQTVKQFVADKKGNSAEINLFTIGLLEAVGIDASPVLISTRQHGLVRYDFPFRHYFNYVLVYANLDGENIITDATDHLNSNYRIPYNCINGKGLLIKKSKLDFVSLSCSYASKISTKLKIDLPNNRADIENMSTEYDALKNRVQLGDNKELIGKKLFANGYSVVNSSISVENSKSATDPYVLKYSIDSEIDINNKEIVVSPFLNEMLDENPLKHRTRKNPVDMTYPQTRTYASRIIIPEGYKLKSLQPNLKMDNELFSIDYKMTNEDNVVNIYFTYSFKYSRYSAKHYQKVKYYFSQIVLKGNKKVVLVKM